MIRIKVFREGSSVEVSGKKVSAHSDSGAASGFTDKNGCVDLNLPNGKSFQVYVDGKQVYRGSIVGVQIVYI